MIFRFLENRTFYAVYCAAGPDTPLYTTEPPPSLDAHDFVFTDTWELNDGSIPQHVGSMDADEFFRWLRNRKLAATDKFMLPDFPVSTATKQALLVYRQSLRDLPKTSNPSFSHGVLVGVVWPVSPVE